MKDTRIRLFQSSHFDEKLIRSVAKAKDKGKFSGIKSQPIIIKNNQQS